MPAKGLLVRFYTDAVHMPFKSEREGRPIFEDRQFVQIIPIGDTKTVNVHEVTQADKERFPDEWAQFQKGETTRPTGTPLREWPMMRPAQVKMLEYLNIYSIEQLSEIDDQAIQRIGMGGRELVTAAKAYLLKAKDTGGVQALAAENERMKSELAQMREQMDQMSAMIQAQEPERRGPGRPPKQQAAA